MLEIDDRRRNSVAVQTEQFPAVRMRYGLEMNDRLIAPKHIYVSDCNVRVDLGDAEIVDEISVSNGLVSIRRSWTLRTAGRWSLNSSFLVDFAADELFVPAVLYRRNNTGTGAFPRGGLESEWEFMEDRTPVPCGAQVYTDQRSALFCMDPADTVDRMASLRTGTDAGALSLLVRIPGREGPQCFSGKHTLVPAGRETPQLVVRDAALPYTFARTFNFFETTWGGKDMFRGYRDFLGVLNAQSHAERPHDRLAPWDTYFQFKLDHLAFLTERDAVTGNAYVHMGKGNGPQQDIYEFTGGSFLVKSIEAAWIHAANGTKESDSDDSRLVGEAIGRFFLEGEIAPGRHQDNLDLTERKWAGYLGVSENERYGTLINARCNGECMRGYLRLYEELNARGIQVPEFLGLALRVADFYVEHQLQGMDTGSFGRWWSVDGTPVDGAGTNGAHIVSFLTRVEPLYPSPARLSAAIDAAGRYYERLTLSGDFFGDTLDADAYDRESGVALLSMFLDLYERDGDKRWLDAAVHAADYVLTWIWQYDCVFDPDSPMGIRQVHTAGLSSVSVAHHHLDFYGPAIAYEYLRLHEHTGIRLYEQNAISMLNASRQLLAGYNGDYLGRGPEYRGWQPEQINHTNWDYFDRGSHGRGTYDICIAWTVVLGLSAYLDVQSRFPEYLQDD